jgi:glycosyltransferase involved in cell wall biosynthesis
VKVVHVITGLDQGGAEAMLEKLLLAARRCDPQIAQVVVCLGRSGVVGDRMRRAGFEVEFLGLRRRLSFAPLLRLVELVKPPAVVQTWLWHADLAGGLCARVAGNTRVVWNLRNSMPELPSTKLSSRAVALLCGGLARWVPAKIICNSRAALQAHVAIGYDAGKCVIVPNGFDLRQFCASVAARDQVRAGWRAAAGELLVGMVARVDPQKDHSTFIRAAASVAECIPAVRFVLVGSGVTTDPKISGLLRQLSLEKSFILEERREDIPDVMSALDLFCLASRSEGFPNVLGEAMACAIPAVATDAGDAREIIADDRLLCEVGSHAGLAACMRYVLSLSSNERRELGLAQRRSVEERYDIENVWRRYRALYESL